MKTTNETLIDSFLIPANTIKPNDRIVIRAEFSQTNLTRPHGIEPLKITTMKTIAKNEMLERMFGTQIYLQSAQTIDYLLSVIAGKELIQDYIGGFPHNNFTYSTNINELDNLAVKPEWFIKSLEATSGFISVFINPTDGVVIVENGLGMGSQTFKYALK